MVKTLMEELRRADGLVAAEIDRMSQKYEVLSARRVADNIAKREWPGVDHETLEELAKRKLRRRWG